MAYARHERYRPVLGLCTGLMALGLLTFAIRPGPLPPESAPPHVSPTQVPPLRGAADPVKGAPDGEER